MTTSPNNQTMNIRHDLKVPQETISGLPKTKLSENVRSAIARGLPELKRDYQSGAGEAAVVVGGPSINYMVNDIRKVSADGATIFTVKAVWRWLVNIGVVPDYCMMIDPHPTQVAYVRGAPLGMKWIVASQCDPAVFDALIAQGSDVTLFHVPTSGADNDGLRLPDGSLDRSKMLVPGGGGVGSRTVRIATLMRHSPLHLFGFDCCYQNGSSADPGRIASGAVPSHVYRLARGRDEAAPIEMNGRLYMSTWAFLTETVDIMQLCASGLLQNLHIHGPGMLTDTINEFMTQSRRLAERKAEGISPETFGGAAPTPFLLEDDGPQVPFFLPSTEADAMASARAAD